MEIENQNSNNSCSNRLDNDSRLKLLGYYECCQDQKQTAEHFGVHQSTVSRLISKFSITNDFKDYFISRRPKKLDSDHSQQIKGMIEENKYVSSKEIAEALQVNKTTVLQNMQEMGFRFSTPTIIPQLNQSHIKKRYDHSILMKTSQWRTSSFQMSLISNYTETPLEIGIFATIIILSENHKLRSAQWSMGQSAGKENLTYLFATKGIRQILLEKSLIPYTEQTYQNKRKTRRSSNVKSWSLIQDNAPSHRSTQTKQFLEKHQINLIPHPPNSPDLNPIELVWAILKRRVEKQQPKNVTDLREAITLEWTNIQQQQIQSCIKHFQKRIAEVYNLNGCFY